MLVYTAQRSLIAGRRKPHGSFSTNSLFNRQSKYEKKTFPTPSGAEIYSCEKSQSAAEPGYLRVTFTGLSFHRSLKKSRAQRLSPHSSGLSCSALALILDGQRAENLASGLRSVASSAWSWEEEEQSPRYLRTCSLGGLRRWSWGVKLRLPPEDLRLAPLANRAIERGNPCSALLW